MPWRCAGVGIVWKMTFLRFCLNSSPSAKKNALFLTIGPPKAKPVLVPVECGLHAGRRPEEPRGVQRGIAVELPAGSAELVGAALVGRVDRGAAGATVFRARIVGDDLELGHCVGRRLHRLVREALVARAVRVVVEAVEQEVVERAPHAVDVEGAFTARDGAPRAQRRQADARAQERQRRVLAAIQRELHRLLARDELAALARIGFEEC